MAVRCSKDDVFISAAIIVIIVVVGREGTKDASHR